MSIMYDRDDLMSLYRATALNLSLLNVKNSKESSSTQLKFWVQLLLPLNLFNRSVVMRVIRMYLLYQSLRIGIQIFMFADVVMQWIVKQ